MISIISAVRTDVRSVMRQVARMLNSLSGGKLSPNSVTIVGLIMHIPIAVLIAHGSNMWAAILLVVFGLFDTLDGELARLQGGASVKGMLLDASTDKMKEALLYTGAAYALAVGNNPVTSAWATAACGASLCVSYVKAKGEAAVASGAHKVPHAELNRMFSDGLMTFEVRMVVLLAGLLAGKLLPAMVVIAVLASYTALQRLVRISQKL